MRKLFNKFRVDAAIRVIKYANDYHFFEKGKNMDNYSAASLYITLRIKQVIKLLNI